MEYILKTFVRESVLVDARAHTHTHTRNYCGKAFKASPI